ncbi:MAG: CIC family chloride channel protein [Oleiphilaceae bacterium]|jgi:CIC family chloride channel protein
MFLKTAFSNYKHLFRQKLSGVDALPQLAILGLIAGSFTAGVILLFRLIIEWPLAQYLPNGDPENFEGLSNLMRAVLPISGAVLIGTIWYRLQLSQRKVGVAFVMERLNYHQGYINFKSLVIQFVGGVLTILSGQSAGREGPAVHLGAASSSLIGQYLKLPNNSIRILISCGSAAAISASFNTPIAGVIFAMEVVMMEYTIAGFTPVILASVAAAIITQTVYGADPAFLVPQLYMNSLAEVPYIILCGIAIGVTSALFVNLIQRAMHFSSINIFFRILAAGAITAAIAVIFPQIMGIGYDTVNQTLLGKFGILMLCAIALAKILATSISVGLGMPNGLVGPTLFIGATVGGALGLVAEWFMPSIASSPGFYAMLGMGAMMGSVLQAPLAALLAILELTQNPNIILPSMLIIVVSSMVASEVFKQKSVFLTILKEQGLDYHSTPVTQALRRVSVGAIMTRKFCRSDKIIRFDEAKELLRQEPKWVLINGNEGKPVSLLPTIDLANYLEENESRFRDAEEDPLKERLLVNLLEIPAQRKDLAPLYFQATLQEALDKFAGSKTEALYVERTSAPMISRVIGVVTRGDIENYYQYKNQ